MQEGKIKSIKKSLLISNKLNQLRIIVIPLIVYLITIVSCSQVNNVVQKQTKSNQIMEEAISLFDEQNFTGAIALLNRSVEIDNDNYGAYVNRAYAYENINDLDKAATDLEHVITTSPSTGEITYFNLGNVYFKQSKFTEAITAYTTALQYNSRLRGAFLNRGNSYVSVKNYEAAISDYESFLKLLNQKESRPEVIQMVNLLKEMVIKQ